MESNKIDSREGEVSPPAYEVLGISRCDTRLSTPPPATNGEFYFKSRAPFNLALSFFPAENNHDEAPPWFGMLDVKCDNLPKLMCEGFHWTEDNVLREEGFIGETSKSCSDFPSDILQYILDSGLIMTRSYFLRDMKQEPPLWVGHFRFSSTTTKILADIRLGDLSLADVYEVEAWGARGESVYRYSKSAPEIGYNAIYDDKPLDGWWPWPKRR
ncbi:hypothetical protein F4819DRAFT_493282 [Hypoxylon fuscum]|nr:hypothetical protein F4819DRAFT_493282 [Hypoxylon fuscum]